MFARDLLSRNSVLRRPLILADYVAKTARTLRLLSQGTWDVVVATSPPSPCVDVCWLWSTHRNVPLVVDAHNGAFERRWLALPFYRTALEKARCVLVHNEELRTTVSAMLPRVTFKTLGDPPFFPAGSASPQLVCELPYCLVILSYDDDEPLEELFAALQAFLASSPSLVRFVATGNYRKRPRYYQQFRALPGIHFSGFLPPSEYRALLLGACAVVSLSRRAQVQQCGAVEAMAAGLPLLTSDGETSRGLFPEGAVLVQNRVEDIVRGLSLVLSRREELASAMVRLREERRAQWETGFALLFGYRPTNTDEQDRILARAAERKRQA